MNSSSMFTLYRIFDAQGTLLYVGRSVHGLNRIPAHIRKKAWAQEMDVVRLVFYPSATELNIAELDAIQNENPKYNIAGLFVGPRKSGLQKWLDAHPDKMKSDRSGKAKSDRSVKFGFWPQSRWPRPAPLPAYGADDLIGSYAA